MSVSWRNVNFKQINDEAGATTTTDRSWLTKAGEIRSCPF